MLACDLHFTTVQYNIVITDTDWRSVLRRQPACYLATWLPGYLATWLPGYLATWLPGYLATWLPGYLATWLPVYLATWLAGYLATWLPGYLATWLPGYLATWLPGYLATCYLLPGYIRLAALHQRSLRCAVCSVQSAYGKVK
jgi:hypothetical protein